MIELKGVGKKYGITKAVEDVSFTLPQGQIVGLFGENGAGKTTLMKCILGLLPHQGSVTLDGAPSPKRTSSGSVSPPVSTPSFRRCRRKPTGTSIRPIFPGSMKRGFRH